MIAATPLLVLLLGGAVAVGAEPPAEVARVTLPFVGLVDRAPFLGLGGGDLGLCAGERVEMSTIEAGIQAAERAIAYLDLDAARVELTRAWAALPCLHGPVLANSAARIPFLAGIASWQAGDGRAADSFVRSLAIRPMQPWDRSFPPEALDGFEAARARLEGLGQATLRFVPPPPADALWVDGQPLPVGADRWSGPPGPHLVQRADEGWATALVELPPGGATLVVPAWLPPDLDGWIEDPARREALGALLSVTLPARLELELTAADGRWTSTVGSADWATIPPAILPRRSPWPRLTLGAGVATLAAGGAVAIGGWTGMRAAIADAGEATTWRGEQRIQGRYDASVALLEAGRATAIAGVALSGAGVGLVIIQDRAHGRRMREALR